MGTSGGPSGRRADVVDAQLVTDAYTILLGRPPENAEAISLWQGATSSRRDLVRKFLASDEFLGASADLLPNFGGQADKPSAPPIASAPPMRVEWDVAGPKAEQLLGMVAATWSQLGETKPHWSVLSDADFLPEQIEANRADFYASGAADVALIEGVLRRHGRALADFPVCMEFGVGVGRVTRHLAGKVQRLLGCDISPSHLALAREALDEARAANAELVQATVGNAFGMETPFDFWFSRIVLQHNPPPVIAMILRQTFARLKPGGLALFQVPTYAVGYAFQVDRYLDDPGASQGIEMHCLPQQAVFQIAAEAGCVPLEIREDNDTGHPSVFVSNTFLFGKR
ncbi:MAG: class I SAM-dependent methyltransferase [Alphaproteobacteria bacterium]